MQEADFRVAVGNQVKFAKTVSESDVYLFAGITGDLSDVHCNAQYMSESAFGERIAHGVLSMGLMSTASTLMFSPHVSHYTGFTPVSQGYERVRFVAPVFFGDTLTITYTVSKIEAERLRCLSEVVATNQHGAKVASATHIMRWVALSQAAKRPQ
jgi:acyl dehydratase